MTNQEEHEGRAAGLIQNAFRCHISRASYYELLGMAQLGPEEKELLLAAEKQDFQKKSALTIQCAFRCYLSRASYYELLGMAQLSPEEKELLLAAEKQNFQKKSALTIQCAFRCYLSRASYYELLGMAQLAPNEEGRESVDVGQEGEHREQHDQMPPMMEEEKPHVLPELSLENSPAAGGTIQQRPRSGVPLNATKMEEEKPPVLPELSLESSPAAGETIQQRPRSGVALNATKMEEEKPPVLPELSWESSPAAGETIQQRPRSGVPLNATQINDAARTIQCAYRSSQARNLYYELLGAGLAQQTMEESLKEEVSEAQETTQSGNDERMQLLIREGMALLSSSSDFDATVASPELQALIDKAKDLWAELGDEEATEQVLSLQGTMDHDEAAVLQQMVDLVVEGQATETSAAAGAVTEDKMQLLIREGMALLSSSSDFDATVASPEMQALIDKAKDLWAELGDEEATAQVLSLQGTMDHDEAAVLQQMVDLVVEGQATETSAAAGAVAEDKMQLLIREGMALLSSSSDFDATVASPEMQALIDKAKDLWAELGDEEATAQVLSLQGTMDHDEAAVLQQMVDLVVFGAEGGQEELEPTAVIVGEEANEEGEGESAQGADDVPGSSAVAAGEGSVVVDDQTGVVHAGADEGGAGAGGQREAEQEVPATTASQAEGKRTEESTTEELRQEQDFVVKRKQAAVAVQCALRGRRARVHVQEMRQKAAWQTQCAVRIQAVVRGHGGRRQAQSVRGQQTAEKEEGKEEQEGQAAAQLKEEEETGGVEGDAATRSEIEELTLMLAEAERKQALEVIVREEEERQRKEEKEQQEAAALKEEEEKRALRLRDLAAVRIQAVARGHRGRMLFNEVKGGYNGIQEESSLESLGEELLISSKEMLQRLPSGARRELRRAVASGDSQLVHLIREACALTIQCALRGKFARTQMQNRMTEMVKEDFVEDGQHQAEELLISSKEMLQRLPSGARRELRRAVASGDSQLVHLIRGVCSLTIQCALRGKFARTQMQNRMTEMVKEDFVEDGQYQAAVDETAGWDRQRSAREAVEASQSEGEVELWDAGERKYTEEIAPTVGSAEADTDGSQHSVTVQREPSAEKPRLSKVHVVMKPRKSAWTARVEKERSESPPPLDRAARIREYSENHRQKKQAAAARREAEHRLQEGFSSPTGFQPHLYTSQSYRYDSPHARRPDGQVMLRYENGDSYEGGWSNNHPEGYGTFVWAEGDRYTGQWKAGRRHGQGEYDWADGSKFTGWWLQGKQGGKGCFEWPDGRAYSGVWTARPDGMEKHTREVRERRVYTSKTKIGGCTIQRRESSLASWTPEKAKEMAKSQSRSRASSPSRPGTAASYASQAETASPANSRPITAEGTLRPGLKEERPAEFGKGGKAKKRVNTSLSSSTSTLGKIRHVRDPLDRGGGRATPGEGGETLFKLLLDDGDQRVGSQISEENLEWNMDNLETIYAYDVKAAYQRSPRPSYAPSSSSSVRRLYTALSASSNVSDPLPMPRVFKMFDSPQGDPRPSIQGMLSEMQQSISPFQSQTPPRSAPSALHVRSPPPTAPDLKSPQSPIRTPPGFASPSRRKLTRSETFLMLDHVRQHEKAIEHAKESRNAVRDLLEDEARAIKMGQRGDSKLSMLFGKFSEGGESDVQNGVMGQRFFLDCLTSLGVVGGAKVDEHGGVEHIEGVVKKQDAIDLFNSCRRSSSRSVERHRMTIQDFRVAMDKLNDILDGKCFQKLAPAVLRQQSMMSPTASRFSAPAAASGSPEMKELHRLIERQKRGNPPFGWGADIVARNRKKNLFFDNPFHDPLFEFEQVRSYM